MGISVSTVVSSIPKPVLRRYFEAHPVEFPEEIDWSQDEKILNKAVTKVIKSLSRQLYDPLHIHFERLCGVANEKGIAALINGSEQPETLEEQFKGMDNQYHMAMTVFLDDHDLFQTAEELLLVDFRAEGQDWKHCVIKSKANVTEFTQEDANAFAFEVANVFYRNFDDPNECCGEIYKRYHDGTLQISVYVNSLPDSNIQVKNRELHRVDTKRAIVSAIVYDPQTKHFCSVASGGKPIHEKIQQAFSKTILKEEKSEYVTVQPRQFMLERFRKRPKPHDSLFKTAPEHGIEQVRLRKLDLFSNTPHKHALSLDTLSQGRDADIYDNRAICSEDGTVYSKYAIIGAQISFHFYPPAEGKKGRTLHITLKKDSSNLKNQKEADRMMIEGYLKSWGLIEEEECLKTGTSG